MLNPPLSTLNDLFRRVAAAANSQAVLWRDEFGHWQPISSEQLYQRVRALALALLGWGVQRGDRVALIGENRWEWAVTDFATMAIGAVNVPIYPTLPGEQMAVQVADAGCRLAIVSTRAQFDKLKAVRGQTALERIVMMDSAAVPEGVAAFSEVLAGADARGSQRDPAFDALMMAVKPEDAATLIYTSGTTGEPKGVMLTHGNLAANQNFIATDFTVGATDTVISFLPLSHVTARALDYAMYSHGVQVAYCSRFNKVTEAMQQVRPTIFVGVPRVYEKVREAVEQRAAMSPLARWLLAWAVRLGAGHAATVYDGRQPFSPAWKLANRLVYARVRRAFGERGRIFISGGAPLGRETAEWFAAMGVALWEGYGLTETSPVIALNSPRHHRLGSVGKPLPNVELKLAEDGELLVRGPSVFTGYWQKPALTAAAFDAEGWFHTGDIARLDKDGFLFITDRKKELLKTSGGKLVAPQPIESKLESSPFVAHAALAGDRHKFISVLIAPNFAELEPWARLQGAAWQSRAALVADSRVLALYGEVVRKVNGSLANFETLKRFHVVAEEWSQESGELTPSMKLKRRVITAKYAAVIDAFYADEAIAHGEWESSGPGPIPF